VTGSEQLTGNKVLLEAWVAGDRALIRRVLAAVAPERIGADPVLAAIGDAGR